MREHISSLFVLVSHLQQTRLVEHIADQLHPDRQASSTESTGNTDRRETCQVHRNREQVCQIHRQRIIGMGTRLERRLRRRGGQENIHLLKRSIEIASNQRSNLLGLAVVGVNVTGRKGIGPDQDPPLHFRAKTFCPASGRH